MQAQVLGAAALGLRARSTGLRLRDVSTALNQKRTIVRTWLMRGTLHLVAADDLRWMLGILGPVFAAGSQARHAQLGLDSDTKARGVAAIRQILLESGPLTRYELVDRLRRGGISLDPKTQAPIHLIRVAALQGVLCLGPERDNGEPTYVSIDGWIETKESKSPRAPLAELARRYFASYGPATLEDFLAWSGLPVAKARSALTAAQAALAEVTVHGRTAFLLKGRLPARAKLPPADRSVRLLPAFDTYFFGYRSRDIAVPAALQRRLQRGGGWLHPVVVISGRAVAAWRLKKSDDRGQALIESIEPMTTTLRKGIAMEVADIGRFLDLKTTAEFETLTQ